MEDQIKEDKLGGQDGGKYDEKGNSSHYQSQFMEFVRDQERKYGTIVALLVCQSNVDKYNQRAGVKEGVPASKDLQKRDWYFKATQHFMKKVQCKIDYSRYITERELSEKLTGRNNYVSLPEEVIDLLRAEFFYLLSEYRNYVPLSVAIEQK
jgi:hypothetical protein